MQNKFLSYQSNSLNSIIKPHGRKIIIKNYVASTCLVFAFFIFGCNNSFSQKVKSQYFDTMLKNLLKHSVPEVSATELAKISNVTLLDAREKREYDVSHLQKAVWVGFNDFAVDRVKNLPKQTRIVVYCSVGFRSEKVSEMLINTGFVNVSNLYGGIFEWVNNGFKIYNLQNQPTNRIHAYDHIWGLWLSKGEKVFN